MSFAQQIVCARCQNCFALAELLNLCPCGSPLLVRYDIKAAKTAFAKSDLVGRVASLWRYRELLPLQNDANLVSLGEGWTPLLRAKKLGATTMTSALRGLVRDDARTRQEFMALTVRASHEQ